MRESQSVIADDLSSVFDKLYREFGIRKLAAALIVAIWRDWRVSRGNDEFSANQIDDLNARMLQDIGLGHRPDLHARSAAPDWERWR